MLTALADTTTLFTLVCDYLVPADVIRLYGLCRAINTACEHLQQRHYLSRRIHRMLPADVLNFMKYNDAMMTGQHLIDILLQCPMYELDGCLDWCHMTPKYPTGTKRQRRQLRSWNTMPVCHQFVPFLSSTFDGHNLVVRDIATIRNMKMSDNYLSALPRTVNHRHDICEVVESYNSFMTEVTVELCAPQYVYPIRCRVVNGAALNAQISWLDWVRCSCLLTTEQVSRFINDSEARRVASALIATDVVPQHPTVHYINLDDTRRRRVLVPSEKHYKIDNFSIQTYAAQFGKAYDTIWADVYTAVDQLHHETQTSDLLTAAVVPDAYVDVHRLRPMFRR